jgi:serine/threonine-protein kinase
MEVVKILDFGIAKLTNRDGPPSQATRTDIVMGTPLYMSPEQCRGAGNVDLRADIYSLGCIFYEMLCSRPPFVHSWSGELIAAHLHEQPPPPRSLDPSIPPGVEAIVLKMLAKNLEHRHQSMEEVAFAIHSYISTDPSWPAASFGTHRSGPPPAFPATNQTGPRLNSDPPLGGTMLVPPDAPGAWGGQATAAPERSKDVSASTLSKGVASRPHPGSVRPPGTAKVAVAVSAIIALAGMAIAVLFFVRRSGSNALSNPPSSILVAPIAGSSNSLAKTEPPAAEPAPPAVPAQQPVPAELPQATGEPSPEAPAAPVEPAAGIGAAPNPAPGSNSEIHVSIVNARAGLTVRVDGKVASLPLRLPRDMQLHDLSFSTPNFRPEARRIRADRDQAIRLDNKPGFYAP